jgi:hypothetical protein
MTDLIKYRQEDHGGKDEKEGEEDLDEEEEEEEEEDEEEEEKQDAAEQLKHVVQGKEAAKNEQPKVENKDGIEEHKEEKEEKEEKEDNKQPDKEEKEEQKMKNQPTKEGEQKKGGEDGLKTHKEQTSAPNEHSNDDKPTQAGVRPTAAKSKPTPSSSRTFASNSNGTTDVISSSSSDSSSNSINSDGFVGAGLLDDVDEETRRFFDEALNADGDDDDDINDDGDDDSNAMGRSSSCDEAPEVGGTDLKGKEDDTKYEALPEEEALRVKAQDDEAAGSKVCQQSQDDQTHASQPTTLDHDVDNGRGTAHELSYESQPLAETQVELFDSGLGARAPSEGERDKKRKLNKEKDKTEKTDKKEKTNKKEKTDKNDKKYTTPYKSQEAVGGRMQQSLSQESTCANLGGGEQPLTTTAGATKKPSTLTAPSIPQLPSCEDLGPVDPAEVLKLKKAKTSDEKSKGKNAKVDKAEGKELDPIYASIIDSFPEDAKPKAGNV